MRTGTTSTLAILAVFVISWQANAYARLGDTVTACKQRYGAPQEVNQAKSMMQWQVAKNKSIRCYFTKKNGNLICDRITYIGLDNDAEIKNAFADNAEGSQWVNLHNPRVPQQGLTEWDRADGGYAQAIEGGGHR